MGALGVLMLVFSHYQLLPAQLVEPLARMLKVPPLAAQATLVGVLIGIGYGVFFSVDWAFIQDVIPTQEAGLFMGFSNIATAGSGIIARFIGGFLLDPFNHGPKLLGLPGGFPVIFSIFSASAADRRVTDLESARGSKAMNLDGLKPWGGLAGAAFDAADMVVAGIPYDGSAVYRKGAALAPERIRALSAAMPPVTEDGQLLAGPSRARHGRLRRVGPDIGEGWMQVAEHLATVPLSSLLTVLGGDHCTAIATIAAQARRHPDMQLLWVDAHPDLCDFSRGGRWTCGCAMRRALEVSGIDPARVVIAGGRDYDPEEVEFIKATGILLVSAREMARPTRPRRRWRSGTAWPARRSTSRSTSTPSTPPLRQARRSRRPAALSTRQALDLLGTVLGRTSPVGFDLVEVSPPFDNGDITTLCRAEAHLRVLGNVLEWKALTL